MKKLFVVVAVLVLLSSVCLGQEAVNESAHWEFSGALGVGAVPAHWDLSYRVYEGTKWVGWLDGFWAPESNTLGGGLSASYKPIRLPGVDALGAGVLYDGDQFHPTLYLKKTIADF